MFGETDENSGDWKEGITAKIFKECADDFSGALRWVVFDGPVDANWIESMNTVLDDNKKLCLANSEQIKLTDKMSIVFEVEDLAEASLATVSRCGMIYMEREDLSLRAIYERWYQLLPPIFQSENLKLFFDQIYEMIFSFSLESLKEDVKVSYPINEHHLLTSALKIFESFFFKNKSRKQIELEIALERDKVEAKRKAAALIGEELPEESTNAAKAKPIDKNVASEIFAAGIFAATWGIGGIVTSRYRDTFSSILGSEIRTCLLTNFKEVTKEAHPPDTTEESLYDWYYAFDTKNW